MTLSVAVNKYDRESGTSYPTNVMNKKEKASGGGNDIHVEGHDGRVNVCMSNGYGHVDITHRTTEKLVEALVLSGEGEFLILQILEWKARREGLRYPTRWSELSERATEKETV